MNILMAGAFMALPFTAYYWGNRTPWILYAEVFVLGSFNAFLQASVFGLGGILPFKYMTAIMGGNGVVGCLLGFARMICLASFTNPNDTAIEKDWKGTLAYFIIALVILLIGVVSFFFINSNVTMRKYLTNSTISTKPTDSQLNIWLKISVEAIIVFMTFVVTFLVFPAIAITEVLPRNNLDNEQKDKWNDWSWAIMATLFNVFDTIGRFLPILISGVSKARLYLVLLIRFVFIITFGLFSFYQSTADTRGVLNFVLMVLNMALFAFTNGYSSSLAMGYGPSNVTDENKSIAGNMMSFHLIFGIFIGTMGGKGMSKMLHFFNSAPKALANH